MKKYVLTAILILALAFPAWGQMAGNATRLQNRPIATTAPTDTQVLCWDATPGIWKPCAPGGGVLTFLGLTDTPASYAGSGGYFVKVNAGASALEFTASTVTPHTLLVNTTHSDTATGTVTRGDIIIGNSTPAWAELAKGGTGAVLTTSATDVLWSTYFLSGTPAQTYTFPTTTASIARTDAGQTFTGVNAFTAPTVATSITPNTAANASLGTSLLPFSSVFIGDSATNNIQLINTDATTAKVATFPDVTGTVVVTATSATATEALFATATAGAPGFRPIADGDLPATIKSLTLTAAADGFTITGGTTPRTLTVQTGAVTLTGNSAGSTLVLPSGSTTLGTMASATATDYVAKALYDAYSILYADTDNVPAALTVGASTIVGRKAAGGIVALTGAEALVIAGGQAADADLNAIAALTPASGNIIIGNADPVWSLSVYKVPIADCALNQIWKTDASGNMICAADDTAGAPSWDTIGDATAPGSIDFVTHQQTITSQLNSAGSMLTMTNTVADLTADVSFLDLKYTDSADANGWFIRGYDGVTNLVFSIGAGGAALFSTVGATTFTGALTGNASTASALAADPANCSAGQVALGVTAAGVAECTATPSVTTITGALVGNADTATLATNATNTAITDDTTTAATMYPTWVTANTGNLPQKVTSTKLSFRPDTGVLTASGFAGPLTGAVTGNASSATYAAATTITDDTTTAATMYPLWVTANTGNLATKVSSSKLSFVPSTGILTAAGFAGPLTGAVTGNASTATLAATVTVVDSTDATSFIAMFDSATGSLAVKTDASLTYAADTGILTATGFAGPLTGNVTGNVSGTAATVTGANQAAITKAENLAWVGTVTTGIWDATTIAATAGGTGHQLYVVGDILYADTTTTLARLAATTAGYILTSGGVGTAPTWSTPGAATAHVILDGSVHTDSLAGTVVLGDIIHGNATPKWARLAGNTTTTKKYLTQTGTGAVSAVPVWDTIAAADLPAALTSLAGLTETAGGIPYGTADNAYAWLAAGAAGKHLQGAGAAPPTWTTSTYANTYAIGTILHASAANTVSGLAAGTTGQILTGVTGAAPAWTTVTIPATVAIGSILAANTANILTAITSSSGTYFLQNANGVISWGTPAGAGDVTGVGDCTGGACLDGTSDGGTYIELYHASGNTRLVNTAGVLEAKTAAGAAYASFKSADITTVAVDGSNKLTITNNTAITGGDENALFPEANVWKVTQGGAATKFTLVLSPGAGQVKFTGPTVPRSFTLPDEASNLVHTATGAATDNVIARMDGTTGRKIQDSTVTLSDTGDLTLGAGYLSITEMAAPGAGAANTARIYALSQPTTGYTLINYVDSGGMVRNLVRDSIITVTGTVVAGIAAGEAVYATGTATNNYPNVAKAKADSITTMPAICVAIEAIANGGYGRCMQVGQLENINTLGLVAGDPMYISPTVAGALTTTPPVVPFLRQEMGSVLIVSATVGSMQVLARSLSQNDTGTALNDWQLGAGTAGTAKRILFHGAVDGILTWTPTSSTRTITLPDASGSVPLGPTAGFITFTGPTVARSYALPDADTTILTTNAAITVAQGGTGLTSGTEGGIPWFTTTTALASSALLAQYGIMIGGGIDAAPSTLGLGSAGQLMRSAGAGATPAWSTATFADTYAIGGLLVASATNTVTALATGTTGQILVGVTGAVPAWGTDLPTATTIGTAYVYRVGGTDVSVADGGTGLSSGTEGGIPWYTTTTAMASSALLAANAVMIGGGIDAAPSTITVSTTTTHALFATAGAPTFRSLATADLPAALPAASTMATSLTVPDIILTSVTAGSRLTGGNGTLTIKGEGDGTDENLIINLNVADKATISTSTGVVTLDFSALNLVTTGTIQAGVTVSSDGDGMDAAAMAAAGMYGTLFIATGAGTWILPRAVLGMSACLMDSGTAHDLILDVTAGSTIRLKGTEQADGIGITNAAESTTGDFVCVVAVATDKWSTMGIGGTWASQ